jgi:hypothetical protein
MTETVSAFDALFPSPDDVGEALAEFEGAWPENIEHVSASSFKLFSSCPEQFRRRYLLGERQPPGAALVWGTADHKASEFNYRQKIESGVDLPLKEVQEVFAATVDAEVSEAGGLNEMDWKPDERSQKRKTIADVKDRGVKGVAAYHTDVAPYVQPEALEDPFSIRVPGVPVPIIGFLDVIAGPSEQATGLEAGDPMGMRRIIDRKTSGKKVNKPDADWQVQASVYQLARWLPHEWHVTVKTQNPYAIAGNPALLVKASTARKQFIMRMIRSLMLELGWCYLTFGADEPWPATRALVHSWRCDYCGFSDTCEWIKGSGR